MVGKTMVSAKDKTTVTVSKDTREWLILLQLEIQAAKKQQMSQDDIVRMALGFSCFRVFYRLS
jgi:hypothetical protein